MFTGQNQVGEALHREETQIRQTARNTAAINRQIRSLVPGQTISGEIVGRNGGEVQIKLSEDMVLNARVDRNLNIEIGKNMTFEVKNNGSSLTLSPLFTNVSTDVNVLKALDMAGLPVNRNSVEMTEKLMGAGLPVNRNTLIQVYREINSFPLAQISDVVDLHRLQMPVNEANLNQMTSYRNLTHQILQGMEAVADALPEVFNSLQAEGDAAGAVKLYQELFMLVQEGDGEGQELTEAVISAPEDAVQQEAVQGETAGQGDTVQNTEAQDGTLQSTAVQDGASQDAAAQGVVTVQEDINITDGEAQKQNFNPVPAEPGTSESPQEEAVIQGGQAADDVARQAEITSEVPGTLRAAVAEEVLSMVKEMPLTDEQMAEAARQAHQFAAGEIDVPQFMRAMNQLAGNMESIQLNGGIQHNEATLITENQGKAMQVLANMFSQPSFQKLLNGQLKKMWTVSSKEVAEPGKIEELYRRLDKQLKGLSHALENAGQAGSAAYKAASNMSQNVDFLQQINQMYAYVQLPLRLQQGEAHGELYVYTNKKHLAHTDGKVSALLHLDMEYLGPVDVYVTLQNSKVNTNFRVRDDEMLEFLSEHMDLLTERLKKRGYDCTYSMTTKGEIDGEAAESGIAPILQQEKGIALAQYAFDVRT